VWSGGEGSLCLWGQRQRPHPSRLGSPVVCVVMPCHGNDDDDDDDDAWMRREQGALLPALGPRSMPLISIPIHIMMMLELRLA
jgi:hypothetical protein